MQGIDCTGSTGRIGFLVRHTWSPLSERPVWLSLGTGWEFGGVTVAHHDGQSDSNLLTYTGREIAFGLYGSFAVGEYDKYEDPSSTTISIERRSHTTAQVGIRLTLFP